MSFLTEVRQAVPGPGALPFAPPDAEIRTGRGLTPWLPLLIPARVGLAWLADQWDLGGVFVPGQFAGAAIANFAGAILIGRWQSAHGGAVVLQRVRADDPELYVPRA